VAAELGNADDGGDTAAICDAGAGCSVCCIGNRSDAVSTGTETAGSGAYAVGAVCCVVGGQGAVEVVGAVAPASCEAAGGEFHARVLPVSDRAAALSPVRSEFEAGVAPLCITGKGSPW